MLRSILALCVLAASTTATAAPLQPTSKWEVEYAASKCSAKRMFGEHALAFQPAPFGLTSKFTVVGPGRALRVRQYPATVDPVDGNGGIKASSLIYPLSVKGRRGVVIILPTADAQRIQNSGRLRVLAGHRAVKDPTTLGAAERTEFDLALGWTPALTKALDTCMADLRNIGEWSTESFRSRLVAV